MKQVKKYAGRGASGSEWKRRGFILLFLLPTLLAFCIFYLYPLLTVFFTSFAKWDYTNLTKPEFWGWTDLGTIISIFLRPILISGKHCAIR